MERIIRLKELEFTEIDNIEKSKSRRNIKILSFLFLLLGIGFIIFGAFGIPINQEVYAWFLWLGIMLILGSCLALLMCYMPDDEKE